MGVYVVRALLLIVEECQGGPARRCRREVQILSDAWVEDEQGEVQNRERQ